MSLVGPTLLTADPDTSNIATYPTPDFSPTAGALIVVGVSNTDGTNAILPTLSQTFAIQGSWTEGATWLQSTSLRRITGFWAIADATTPGAGRVDALFGADAQTGAIVTVVEFTGQDATTPILQFAAPDPLAAGATSLTIATAGALQAATSMTCCFITHNANEAQAAIGGGTLLAGSDVGYATPSNRMAVSYAVNDTSHGQSWTTSSAKSGFIFEVVEAVAGGATEDPFPYDGGGYYG